MAGRKQANPGDPAAARTERLEAEMRANLKRRKAQARARGGERGAGGDTPSTTGTRPDEKD